MRYSQEHGGPSLTPAIFPADVKMSGDVASSPDSHGALSQVDTGRGFCCGRCQAARGRVCQSAEDGAPGAGRPRATSLDTKEEARGGDRP